MSDRVSAVTTHLALAGLVAAAVGTFGAQAGAAQECPAGLQGAWTGTLPAREIFQLQIDVPNRGLGRLEAHITSVNAIDIAPVWTHERRLRFQSAVFPVAFDGHMSADSGAISGFLYHGSYATQIRLPVRLQHGGHAWSSEWTALGVSSARPRLDLYIGGDGEGGLGGFFFFRDQRLPNLSGYGLACNRDTVVLHEQVLGLDLSGQFNRMEDRLELKVTGLAGSAPLTLSRMADDDVPAQPNEPEAPARAAGDRAYLGHAPEQTDDGWPTARPTEVGVDSTIIADMVRAIVDGDFPLTHSVLVARAGKLVVEEYFYGYDRDTWHDMRSASKTVTSMLVGLAIRAGHIKSASAKALTFFPRYHRYGTWDPRKASITIRHLLTMSSGLDANDSDRRSVASERAYQSQRAQPDWIKLALDAPMIADPGSRVIYGGANPLILGGILAAATGEPVEQFAHRALFHPLGIERYRFFLDPTGIAYMGGGLYLRPRDMLKLGQVYASGGVWQGKRILPEEWIRESWGRYGRLEPLDRNGHQYGYLWWHHRYDVGGHSIETVEARGNGGQYIFVVPTLDLVVVITAGNYREGLRMTRQPEAILQQFVLPAVVASPSPGEAR